MSKVAAIQMVSCASVEKNLDAAAILIQQAVDTGAELIALPEDFAMLGLHDGDRVNIKEQPGNGPIQAFLSTQAQQHKVWILGGTVPIASALKTKVRSVSFLFDSNGGVFARYDKIHLFNLIKKTNEG